MFSLEKTNAKFTNLNIRQELHGDEKKLGCDLAFSFEESNKVLDMFDPELREMLYKAKPEEDEDLVDKAEDEKHLTVRRFPNLNKALPWDWKGVGYRMEINVGISGMKDIYAIDTTIDKWKFELKDGGTVKVDFRLQCKPSAEEIGQLSELLTHNYSVLTLEPPSAEERAQMELDEAREEVAENPAA